MKSITDNELNLLKIIWKKGELSAKIVHEESLKEKKRNYMTIKTTLDIIVDKGYLNKRKFGPIWLYSSNVSEKSFFKRSIKNFIENILDDNILPVFTYMIENKKIKKEEINKIKGMIELLEKKE